jgi:hypothetical protein
MNYTTIHDEWRLNFKICNTGPHTQFILDICLGHKLEHDTYRVGMMVYPSAYMEETARMTFLALAQRAVFDLTELLSSDSLIANEWRPALQQRCRAFAKVIFVDWGDSCIQRAVKEQEGNVYFSTEGMMVELSG